VDFQRIALKTSLSSGTVPPMYIFPRKDGGGNRSADVVRGAPARVDIRGPARKNTVMTRTFAFSGFFFGFVGNHGPVRSAYA